MPVELGGFWRQDVRLASLSRSDLGFERAEGEGSDTTASRITMGVPIGVSQTKTVRLAVPTGNSTGCRNGAVGHDDGSVNAGAVVGGKVRGLGSIVGVLAGVGLAALVL